MMKSLPNFKNYFAACLLALGGIVGGTAQAQHSTILESQSLTPFHAAEAAPNMARQANPSSSQAHGIEGAAALWDQQLVFNATDSANGDAGMAACLFFNNEFWASRWASDTLYRFDATGSLISEFVIAGLSGTRALTTDGTSLYAGNASNTIYQINPVSQTVTATIASAATVTARHCTYDPTLNAGGGGFWIGNFNTDIVAISMAGAVLTTIPAATHTLGGMYGSAYDGISTGGPYLWVFHQGGANATQIDQLQLPAGTPTGVSFDVFADLAPSTGLTSALAGGLFISSGLVTGQNTIGGLAQGTPSNTIFAYELSDPTPAGPDAAIGDVSANGYTIVPTPQAASLTFNTTVGNVSLATPTINTITVDFELVDQATSLVVFTDQQTVTNVAQMTSVDVTSAAWAGAVAGDYDLSALITVTGTQMDTFPTNDSAFSFISIDDTLYARDDGNIQGSLSIGGGAQGSPGFIGQEFDITVTDTLTHAFFWLDGPTMGDTIHAVVIPMGALGPAGAPIATSEDLIVTDTAGATYQLAFTGGVELTAGSYFLGLEETTTGALSLGTSNNIFSPLKGWVFFNGNWNNSEDFNFNVAYVLRAVFSGSTPMVGIDADLRDDVAVYPNPAEDYINVAVSAGNQEDLQVNVIDIQGRVLIENAIPANTNSTRVFVGGLAKGIYLLEVNGQNGRHIERISIR